MSFWKWLFTFDYKGTEGIAKVACQVMFSMFVVLLYQGLNGRSCGSGWNFWSPQTWGSPIGCGVRGFFEAIPDGPAESVLPGSTGGADLLEPPVDAPVQSGIE